MVFTVNLNLGFYLNLSCYVNLNLGLYPNLSFKVNINLVFDQLFKENNRKQKAKHYWANSIPSRKPMLNSYIL